MKGNKRGNLIREIFKNNSELYDLIWKQVYLLEKYECDFKDYIPVNDFMDEYEDMLNLIGITSRKFLDEWDDEADRKS
ncbi:MAG: hypothetical protein Unbinned2990contig1002_13 [Prokaryotic dsDNA virus sp.]|nr:MAG: hypothetical protein Unbinned2990contig1002_13 [Prokaryotic dsDNA virus sp.]|tara:strand:+ start:471 stop:704 length:234 start_codon:yes stop_codon:yes gene_type:complete